MRSRNGAGHSVWNPARRSLGPDTTVAIFPSDHYVSDDARFMRQVERAFDAVDEHPALAVLLGIRPDKAETSYGWIEPAARMSSWTPNLFRVKRFWEKPRWELARTLLAGGCLWNSAVIAARASVLEAMITEHASEMFHSLNDALGRAQAGDEVRAEAVFGKLETVGFSEQVLSQAPSKLAVQLVDDVQWSDLGEPERLIDTLQTLKSRPHGSRISPENTAETPPTGSRCNPGGDGAMVTAPCRSRETPLNMRQSRNFDAISNRFSSSREY
ncbi:MAG: sugar phosphate nucleotidyltransferase [Candidatus Binataceae bacterium]